MAKKYYTSTYILFSVENDKKDIIQKKFPPSIQFVPGLMHAGANPEEKKSGIRKGWVHP